MNTEINNSTREITFENLTAGDTLLLETQNSTYQFMLTESAFRQGLLTGGAFGKNIVKAEICEPFELRAGTHLQFHVEMPDHHIYLKTTTITNLKIVQRRPIQWQRLHTLANYPRPTVGAM